MKLNFTLILTFLSFIGFAQLTDYKEISTKSYPQGYKMSYFSMTGLNNPDQIYFLESRIIDADHVLRFEVFNSVSNTKTCFIEYDTEFNLNSIVTKLNALCDQFNEIYLIKSENPLLFYQTVYQIEDYPQISAMNHGEYITQRQEWIYNHRTLYKKLSHIDINILGQD